MKQKQGLRLELEDYRCLYSPRIREGMFPETGLPVLPFLGNPPRGLPLPRGGYSRSVGKVRTHRGRRKEVKVNPYRKITVEAQLGRAPVLPDQIRRDHPLGDGGGLRFKFIPPGGRV